MKEIKIIDLDLLFIVIFILWLYYLSIIEGNSCYNRGWEMIKIERDYIWDTEKCNK